VLEVDPFSYVQFAEQKLTIVKYSQEKSLPDIEYTATLVLTELIKPRLVLARLP
jgi:hypothetical protein